MAVVRLSGQLQALAGGERDHRVPGADVREALVALEALHPVIGGWILDERGRVRRHIGLFVDGERATQDTPLGEDDRVHVLPAITGGAG